MDYSFGWTAQTGRNVSHLVGNAAPHLILNLDPQQERLQALCLDQPWNPTLQKDFELSFRPILEKIGHPLKTAPIDWAESDEPLIIMCPIENRIHVLRTCLPLCHGIYATHGALVISDSPHYSRLDAPNQARIRREIMDAAAAWVAILTDKEK